MKKLEGINTIYLHPGEIYFTDKPEIIYTILGSCVTIVMHHKQSRYSAISHGLLPECNNSRCIHCSEPYKYMDCSIIKMIEKFEERNIDRSNVEVKMFGGADVLQNNSKYSDATIGMKNISAALRILKEEKLSLTASDLGGKLGRKLIFHTFDGSVYLKKIVRNEKE